MGKPRVCIIIFTLLCIILTGCNSQIINDPDQLHKLIDKNIELTQKAADEKDVKLAREIWSRISEYGIKAKEMDKKELADSLGKLAATYSYLVEYINSGDMTQLDLFREYFEKAVYGLKECLNLELKR